MPEPDSLLDWCDDLHQVRGNVSQLQATLNQILAKAPSVTYYQELNRLYGDNASNEQPPLPIHEKIRTSLNSPQLKVAVRLKSLFDKGLLPFLLGMTRINFKSPKSDRYVGYLLDYCPPKQDVPNISVDASKQGKSGVVDDTELFPPMLPPIETRWLMRQVFTDKSLRVPSDFVELREANGLVDFNSSHNRKLALKGKYVLDSVLIDILDDALPLAHEDDLEYLRFRLTSKHILAKFAYLYNFSEALVHQVPSDVSIDEKLAIFKNTFLAYVGGMAQDSYSKMLIASWLKALYKPLITTLETEFKLNGQLKSRETVLWAEFLFLMGKLNNYFLDPVKKLHYEFVVHEEEPHVCQLEVGTLKLGTGAGSSAKAAKQRAVLETLKDTTMRQQLLSYVGEHIRQPSEPKYAQQSLPVDAAKGTTDSGKGSDAGSDSGSGSSNDKGKGADATKKPAFNPPLGPKKLQAQVNLAKAPLAPLNQPRMPLQYGMIPSAVPKGHKRK